MRFFGPLSFYREALAIALPVMLQQFIMSVVSLVDNFMVAGLGDESMAAVNVANQFLFLFFVLTGAVYAAGGVYLAQFSGAGDPEGMRQAYRFKACLALALAAVFVACFLLIPETLLGILTSGNAARDRIIPLGARYLRLIAVTLVPIALSGAVASSYREIGRPRVPLAISVAATLVNTTGNWLLIYGNLGAPRLGVEGAAVATIVARLVELAAFVVYANMRKTPFYSPLRAILRLDWNLSRRILGKSALLFVSQSSWAASETVMTAIFNGRGGAETPAGMAAGMTIASVFFILFGGVNTTAAVLVGGSLGAGRLNDARRRASWLLAGSVVAGVVIGVVGALAAALLVPAVFSALTAEARRICLGLVFVTLAYMPLWAPLNAVFAVCGAGGDMVMAVYADGGVSVILIAGAFVLAALTPLGPVEMFAVLKLTDLLKFAIAWWFYRKERWVRNLAARA